MRRSIDGMLIYSLKAAGALSGNTLAQHFLSRVDMRSVARARRLCAIRAIRAIRPGVPAYYAASFPSSK
jgi:hypothetical protein